MDTGSYRLIAKRGDGQLRDVELYDMRRGRDPLDDLAPRNRELVERIMKSIPIPATKH